LPANSWKYFPTSGWATPWKICGNSKFSVKIKKNIRLCNKYIYGIFLCIKTLIIIPVPLHDVGSYSVYCHIQLPSDHDCPYFSLQKEWIYKREAAVPPQCTSCIVVLYCYRSIPCVPSIICFENVLLKILVNKNWKKNFLHIVTYITKQILLKVDLNTINHQSTNHCFVV
jgi:hypothetical protein